MIDDLTGAWATVIREDATDLAGKGFVVSLPHYFERTDTPPGPPAFEQMRIHRDAWQAAVAAGLPAHGQR